jgi:hypothetical protein
MGEVAHTATAILKYFAKEVTQLSNPCGAGIVDTQNLHN